MILRMKMAAISEMVSTPRPYLIPLLLTPNYIPLKESTNTNLEKILKLSMGAIQILMVRTSKWTLKTFLVLLLNISIKTTLTLSIKLPIQSLSLF